MAENKKDAAPEDVEAAFQASLEDVIAVIERIERFFDSPRDMLESLRLAATNRGHAKFLLDRIKR